jgi:hypothetical protein
MTNDQWTQAGMRKPPGERRLGGSGGADGASALPADQSFQRRPRLADQSYSSNWTKRFCGVSVPPVW